MATGTLSGNSCSAYGAPATIIGTTSQTVASGHCYLLTLTGTDNVGNAATITTTVMVDTTAPSAPTGFSFSGLDQRLLPGRRHDRLLQGRRGRRLHRHRLRRHRRRHRHRLLQLRRHRRQRLGERRRRLHLHRRLPQRQRSRHRHQQRRTSPARAPASPPPPTPPHRRAAPSPPTARSASGAGTTSYLNSGTTLTINSRTDYTDGGSGLASSTLTMATGTLSGNSCSSYGAPATITGTTSQTVASGNCYLLTLTGTDNVGNTAIDHHHRQGRHHRPVRTDRLRLLRADERVLPRRRLDRLHQGRRRRRLHRHRLRRHRRRHRRRLLQLRRHRRHRLGQRGRRLHLHRRLPHRHRLGHRHQQRRTHRLERQLHRPADSTAPTGGAFTANSVAASGGGSTSNITAGTTLTINSRTDYTEAPDGTASGLATSTLTMATGTLSGNSCSAYGAPATIVGTTSQTVASGHCYLLTLTGTDNVGNAATISTTVKVDTTAPRAPTGFSFSGADQRLLPRRRHDRLLPRRLGRRLHRHRLRQHRRRHRHRLLQLRRRRGRRLVERRRRLHLHRHLAHRYRLGHRHQRRGRHRIGDELHRAVRLDRTRGRRLHRQRPGSLRRRHLEQHHRGHDADDQQPHRLHRGAERHRFGPRQLDADHADRHAVRATAAAPTAHPRRSPAPRRRPSPAATATC